MTSGLRPWRGSTPCRVSAATSTSILFRDCSGSAGRRLLYRTGGHWLDQSRRSPATAFRYRAISRAIILLKGASGGGIEPQALAPAVQNCSATDVLFSIASL